MANFEYVSAGTPCAQTLEGDIGILPTGADFAFLRVVAAEALHRVDDQAAGERNIVAAEQTQLLGLLVRDGRGPVEGVEVVFEERLFVEGLICGHIGQDGTTAGHASGRGRLVDVTGQQL